MSEAKQTQTYPYHTSCGKVFPLTSMGHAHEKRCVKCKANEWDPNNSSVDWEAFYAEDPDTPNEDA